MTTQYEAATLALLAKGKKDTFLEKNKNAFYFRPMNIKTGSRKIDGQT